MRAFIFKPTAIAVALALSVSSPLLAQQAPAGASKASSSAVGGVTAGTIGAAVAVVAAAAALSGGSGGASSASAAGSSESAAAAASSAASAARTANTAANRARDIFGTTNDITDAGDLASELQVVAENAASDLAASANVAIAGVTNPITGVVICVAANTCTAAERLRLAYDAARTAKLATEATLAYITLLEAHGAVRFAANDITVDQFASGTNALASALRSALLAQASANEAIVAYNALKSVLAGGTGTTITASTGTTGTGGATGSIGGFNLNSGGE